MTLENTRSAVREALEALTSPSSFQERLTYAGLALVGMRVDGFPPELAVQTKVLERAFCNWPDTLPVGDNGTVSQLVRMLPEQRQRELVSMVTSLHDSLCQLTGATPSFGKVPDAVGADFILPEADRWEFLYWQLSHRDTSEQRAQYVRYAQGFLPNFPADALLEWPGRHGYHSMRRWAFLGLENLRFEQQSWSVEELARIRAYDDGFTEVGPGSHGAHHVGRKGDWAAGQIRQQGTWGAPILVLSHGDDLELEHRVKLSPGFTLIEGHTRLSRMLNMPANERRDDGHQVLVVNRKDPAASP